MSNTTPADRPSGTSPDSPVAVWFAGLMDSLSVVRAPLVMGVITILALWLPEQVREVYRVLVQQATIVQESQPGWQWPLALGSLFLLSIILWQLARELTYAAAARRGLDQTAAGRFVFDWSPRLLATAPFIGTALGFWYSWFPRSRLPEADKIPPLLAPVFNEASTLQSALATGTFVAVALAIAVLVATTIIERSVQQIRPGTHLTQAKGRVLTQICYRFLFPIVAIVSIVFLALQPMVLPQFFGVVPIFALWMAIVAMMTAAGTRFYDVYRVPLVTMAILAVLIFEFFGWSDNHKFRQLGPDKIATRPSIDEAFSQWIGSRKDADAYRGKKPYPVYIVAAEGGGMYAAYHTAKLLSRIQDMCDNFAQHLFAVSGVSGGSLGGAIFASLAQTRATNGASKPCGQTYAKKDKGFEYEAEQLLADDFLSPLIWAGLFPDFLQKFLPFPVYQFDRALALERTFENAWDRRKLGPKNPFKESLFALCSPGSRTCPPEAVAAPALLLNTTNVETGVQMVLSPLYLAYTAYTQTGIIEDFYRRSAELPELPLSTAVGLSARFPWILPVGWHSFTTPAPQGEKPERRRMSFVDGGYFEGSGVVTAESLAEYLLKYVEDNKPELKGLEIAVKIIMITGSYQPVDRFFQTAQEENSSSGELTVPLVTLLQAWRARSAAVPIEAARERRRGPYIATSAQFDNEYFPLPLGWQLADFSRKYLNIFAGAPQDCVSEQDPGTPIPSVNLSNCVVKEIINDLNPASPATRTGATR